MHGDVKTNVLKMFIHRQFSSHRVPAWEGFENERPAGIGQAEPQLRRNELAFSWKR
jgi:hypothetical protein